MSLRVLLSLLPVMVLSACARFPENEPLAQPLPRSMGYRFENLSAGVANTNSVLVCVSFSGGGVRGGAMAYGVVQALAETRIADGTKTLLDEVDIVSAASGGAFPAAYLGAFGPSAFLRDFRERVLVRDLGMETFWRAALCPFHLVRICSPWFNRSDLAAELYDRTIYRGRTYSDLRNRGRPYVVLNATDMLLGARFEFTQDTFDRLRSSLADLPLARAVAASAAFPVLLTPVAVRDHGHPERYVHLIDGGIVDNLGLGYLLESFQRGVIHDLVQSGEVETLVFVVVNARNRTPEDMSASPQAPGAGDVLAYGLGAAIDRRTDAQEELLAELCKRSQSGGGPAVHVVNVDLEDLPDPQERARLLAVETTFGLAEEEVDELIEASARLVFGSRDFARLVTQLR